MIKTEVVFLEIGVPSYSGVIYDEEAAQKIIDAYDTREVYGYYNDGSQRSVVNPSHMVTNIERVGNILRGNLIILDACPDGLALREAIEAGKNIQYTPSGFGRVEDNVITDFQFMGINAVLDNIEVM